MFSHITSQRRANLAHLPKVAAAVAALTTSALLTFAGCASAQPAPSPLGAEQSTEVTPTPSVTPTPRRPVTLAHPPHLTHSDRPTVTSPHPHPLRPTFGHPTTPPPP